MEGARHVEEPTEGWVVQLSSDGKRKGGESGWMRVWVCVDVRVYEDCKFECKDICAFSCKETKQKEKSTPCCVKCVAFRSFFPLFALLHTHTR